MKKHVNLRVPIGFKEWLPGESYRKRELENKLAELFRHWAYREVLTPTFEFYRPLKTGNGLDSVQEQKCFKFIDRQGEILVLRADLTAPIARLVVSRMQDVPLPLRLFYITNVFRYENPQAGRNREFFQAGVELLGCDTPEADAEVIALAVEAMRVTGLKDFRIGVGQVKITRCVLEKLSLPLSQKEEVKEALAKKDLVRLEKLLHDTRLSSREKEQVLTLSSLHGGREALFQARKIVEDEESEKALSGLEAAFTILESYGFGDKVFLDLGILRDFDYYTGIVFEGYTGKLGFPLCGGGRYDELLGKFGDACPATGFALGLERVMLALDQEPQTGGEQPPDYFLTGNDLEAIFLKARSLREQGHTVEVDIRGLTHQEAQKYAQGKGIPEVIVVERKNKHE